MKDSTRNKRAVRTVNSNDSPYSIVCNPDGDTKYVRSTDSIESLVSPDVRPFSTVC